jgi:TonB family protein
LHFGREALWQTTFNKRGYHSPVVYSQREGKAMILRALAVAAILAASGIGTYVEAQEAAKPVTAPPGSSVSGPIESPSSPGVTKPIVIYASDPYFSKEECNQRTSESVQVYLIVDEKGLPQNVRLVKGLSTLLDEKAIEAVKKYRFKPSKKNGHPVKVELYINVSMNPPCA